MFNYKYESNMTYWNYDDINEGFVVRAKEHIKAGQEIFVYYGNKPNSSFFIFYGFVIENNKNDDAILKCTKYLEDPLRELKIKLMGINYDTHIFKVPRNPDEPKFQKFISYLRFLVFKKNPELVIFIVEIA